MNVLKKILAVLTRKKREYKLILPSGGYKEVTREEMERIDEELMMRF